MQTRQIGSLAVSALGLGCNNFGMTMDQEATSRVVHAAIDAGITYFDTADVYGGGDSESFLGRALVGRRDQVAIGTKFGARGSAEDGLAPGHPTWVRRALDRSLERLGVESIDHYQLHYYDPTTPLADTLGALHELVTAGKIRELGCSNFTAAQLEESFAVTDQAAMTPFRTVQNRYSVVTRTPETDGTLAACVSHGVGLVPYFPLELGMLTGKYPPGAAGPEGSRKQLWDKALTERFFDQERLRKCAALAAFAATRGHTVIELALSWLLANTQVATVIAGATKPEQVWINSASTNWDITDDDRREIDQIIATFESIESDSSFE